MKEHDIEATLKRMQAPAPDPEARLRAKRAALEEFARLQAANDQTTSKETPDGPRPSRMASPSGRDHMAWNRNTKWLAVAASGCIAAIGFAVVWPMLEDGGGERLLDHAATEQPRRLDDGTLAGSSDPQAGATQAAVPENAASRPEEPRPPEAAALAEPKLERDRDAAAATAAKQAERTERQDGGAAAADPAATRTLEAAQYDSSVDAISNAVVVSGVQSQAQAATSVQTPAIGSAQHDPAAPPPATPANARAQQPGANEEMEEIVTTGMRASRNKAGSHKNAAPRAAGGDIRLFQKATSHDVVTPPLPPEGRDQFEHYETNPVKQVSDEPVSTFSVDVDTASYSFVRRQLNAGSLPDKDAVRSEEMINYFDYAWPAATSKEEPFRPTVVVSDSPWAEGRKLVHIGIKGYELPARERPDANLVLLLDVSGSMDQPDKLPLVKDSIRMLVGHLKPTDTVAMVVYAGAAGTVLPTTPVSDKQKIYEALDRLHAGGSTAGAAGIELAYEVAENSFRKDGVNRIILATDGDFNVGIAGTAALKGFVERKREKGVFLSVLGFGQGNYRDELAQALAQNGNGVAAYIDTLQEAQKVLVQEASASLFTIAKDVKLQVEFNPATVAEYRLVGYETRALKREDFNNDAVDAGDVGAGHTVTAIYEITPVGARRSVDPSRYGKKAEREADGKAGEYGFLKIRYKLPQSSTSKLIEQPIPLRTAAATDAVARDVQFSTAVAGFSQLLRGGKYTGALSYDDIIKQALASRGADEFGYRNEFVQLVRRAQTARKL